MLESAENLLQEPHNISHRTLNTYCLMQLEVPICFTNYKTYKFKRTTEHKK